MKDLFEKYRRRLAHIGVFRAVLLGLALSFFAVGAAALIAWVSGASLPVVLGLTVGIGAAVLVAAVPLLYFRHFRPTERAVVEQLDALGLDERTVTMYECQNDPSGMAALQRADAKGKLAAVSAGMLKYSVALPVLLLLFCGALFAGGMTTASVLAAGSSGGAQIAEGGSVPAAEETFTVTYRVYEEGTGTISGELVQTVRKGGYTEPVTAVPVKGYRFSAWVNEDMARLSNQNNPRSEVNVREDMVIYARFEQAAPSSSEEDQSGGEGQGEKEKPDISGGEEELPDPDFPGQGESSSGGGNDSDANPEGKENNKVIDGTQNYKDNFDREQFERELTDKDIPDDLKDILGDYYDTLKP